MYKKSTRIKLMQTEYDVLQAQNVRLAEENTGLRQKLDSLTNNAGSSAATHVEARIIAMKMEDERDNMFDNLERLKKRYNSLQDAYIEKVKRCKALEDTFARQKTLAGLVMRSPIDQRLNEQELAKKQRDTANGKTAAHSEMRLAKMKSDLDAAYDIIDELEFELESIDFLEMENQRLRNELSDLKAKTAQAHRRPSVASSDCSECSGGVDSVDAAVLESVTVTERNLIQTAEVESNCLRRELLRSRLKNTLKLRSSILPPLPPQSPPPPGSLVRSPSENVLNFKSSSPVAVPVPLMRSPSAHTLKPHSPQSPQSPRTPPELPRQPPPPMPLQRSPSANVQPLTPYSPVPLLRSPSATVLRSQLPAPPVPPKPPRRSPSTASTVLMDDALIDI